MYKLWEIRVVQNTVDVLMMSADTVMTTKYGPQGHVQAALNFSSLSDRPCLTHACLNRMLARPIDSHAIYHECSVSPRIIYAELGAHT